MCISGISLAMCTISVCRILFSQHYRYVFGAKQGWYHTVRVPFGIDTIQYSGVLYGIA